MPQSPNGSAPPDTIPYDEAVLEGKEILKQIDDAERGLEVAERRQLRLGELADKLEPKYKDRTLAKFAKAIGVAKCTLDRYRTVYRAWEGKLAPGPNLVSYAVLRELATHPEREQIIRDEPNLTKREAHDKMRKQEGAAKEKQEQEQEDDWLKHNRKWFKNLVALAKEATRAADVVDKCTPEQLENLLQAVDTVWLMSIRSGGKMLVELANHLEALLRPEEEAIEPEHRVKAEEVSVHAAA